MSEVNQLMLALMKAQKEFPTIVKNKEAKGKSFSYKYADLAAVVKGVMPTLEKHGLMFYQAGTVKDGRQILSTCIAHPATSTIIQSDFLLPDCQDPQDAGGNITFFRRYALCAALGIVTEDDTDASAYKAKAPPQPQNSPPFDDIPPFQPPGHNLADSGPSNLSGFICPFGKNKDKTFESVDKAALVQDRVYWMAKLKEKNEEPKGRLKQYLDEINQYL